MEKSPKWIQNNLSGAQMEARRFTNVRSSKDMATFASYLHKWRNILKISNNVSKTQRSWFDQSQPSISTVKKQEWFGKNIMLRVWLDQKSMVYYGIYQHVKLLILKAINEK